MLINQSFENLNSSLNKEVNLNDELLNKDIISKFKDLKVELTTIHHQDLADNEYTYKAGLCYLNIINKCELIFNSNFSIINQLKKK